MFRKTNQLKQRKYAVYQDTGMSGKEKINLLPKKTATSWFVEPEPVCEIGTYQKELHDGKQKLSAIAGENLPGRMVQIIP